MPRSARRVVLRDIAEKAGVTVATVSLALRDSPEISKERRAALQRLARRMGYVPDPTLSALSSYRRQAKSARYRETVAFLFQLRAHETSFRQWQAWPIRAGLVEGLRLRCRQLGYGLECHELPQDFSLQRALARVLRSRGVRSVVVHANMQPVEEAVKAFSSFVILSLFDFSASAVVNHVRSNDHTAMRLALARLRELGYRRLLYLCPNPVRGRFGPEKWDAFWGFQKEHPDMSCQTVDEMEFCRRIAPPIRNRPDVLLLHNSPEWEAVAARWGWRVPQDVGICHLFASPAVPAYSGIDVRPALLASKAVDLLDGLLRRGAFGFVSSASTTLVDPVWFEGGSVAPVTPIR